MLLFWKHILSSFLLFFFFFEWPAFLDLFKIHIFDLSWLSSKTIYVSSNKENRGWDWWKITDRVEKRRQKEVWQRVYWREISGVWKNIQQSRLCFVIQRVRKAVQAKRKEQFGSDFLWAKKASQSSSKVTYVTPELVQKSPPDVSYGSLFCHLPSDKHGRAVGDNFVWGGP